MAVHSFESMGTVVSIRLADAQESERDAATALTEIQAKFALLNETFSLYRPDSEISRIASGDLTLPAASELMLEEYARALSWRDRTAGAFTPHRPDGVLDLSGTIKAVAVQAAADILHQAGFSDFSVNVAGDLTVDGNQSEEISGWVTGIVDPADQSQLIAAVRLNADFPAIATSGSAERGEHIWMRPETEKDFVQATVIAGDILTADVLATAIISGGQASLDQITQDFEVAVVTVAPDGTLLANPRFQELVAR